MMEQQSQERNDVAADRGLNLPPGFCFYPSDLEIVSYYLTNKVRNKDFTCIAFGEVDLNKTEPWDLPDEAKMGDKEWYFFYKKDRKYPTGIRANRATEAGYWKATGRDKEVYDTIEGVVILVGMKKTLVFYKGRAPGGVKTNWVMHEYRLEGSGRISSPTSKSSSYATNEMVMKGSGSSSKDEWVVCRVYEKTRGIKQMTTSVYQVAMSNDEIDQNQNISAVPMSLPLPLPLSVPMPVQLPILQDFATDLVAPYYPNAGVGMASMIPPLVGIGGTSGRQINDAQFGNPMVAPPPMNFYNQMGIGVASGQMDMDAAASQMGIGATTCQLSTGGAVGQIDMGVVGTSGFDVTVTKNTPSSMESQRDELHNAAEILSMVSMTSPGSTATTIEMDGIWNYKY